MSLASQHIMFKTEANIVNVFKTEANIVNVFKTEANIYVYCVVCFYRTKYWLLILILTLTKLVLLVYLC